jgi:hypothetical protein
LNFNDVPKDIRVFLVATKFKERAVAKWLQLKPKERPRSIIEKTTIKAHETRIFFFRNLSLMMMVDSIFYTIWKKMIGTATTFL